MPKKLCTYFLTSNLEQNFERLIYNKLFNFFTDNDLISPNQSGFRPGDSCVNQLIAVSQEIYKSFDDGVEARGIRSLHIYQRLLMKYCMKDYFSNYL